MFLEGYERCIVGSRRGWRERVVCEPQCQTVVRGRRDSFRERVGTN
ncbi:spore germination protein, partial [Priestia megaterium]